MKYNLSNLDKESLERMRVDLAASGVAYKERHNIPVSIKQIELKQVQHLRNYFYQKIMFYRKISLNFTNQHN